MWRQVRYSSTLSTLMTVLVIRGSLYKYLWRLRCESPLVRSWRRASQRSVGGTEGVHVASAVPENVAWLAGDPIVY